MKRIICILLIVMMVLPMTAFSLGEKAEKDGSLKQADALMDILLGEEALSGNADSEISRAEFILALSRLFKLSDNAVFDSSFSDVAKEHEAASAIYTARALGYVDAGTHFYPDEALTAGAAVKLAACYAGYKDAAEKKGGFPTGYFEIARVNGFLKNISSDFSTKAVDYRDAKVLLYNVMLSDYVYLTGMTEGVTHYKKDESILAELHEIYNETGILNASSYSSLAGDIRDHEKNLIEINGITYEGAPEFDKFLGYNCMVFYSEDSGVRTALGVVPVKNMEYSFNLELYVGIKNGEIEYLDEADDKTERLSLDEADISLVVNGCGVIFEEKYFDEAEGLVRAIDNDRDGDIEVIVLEKYRYAQIDSISTADGDIGFSDSYGINNLHLNNDVKYEIVNFSGEEILLHDLKIGDYLAIKESTDGSVISMVLLDKSESGTLTQLNRDEKEMTVGGRVFKLSAYFAANDMEKLDLGGTYEFVLAPNGSIVALNEVMESLEYAYLVAYQKAERTFAGGKLKVFTQGGEMRILSTSEEVRVDGASEKIDGNDFLKKLDGGIYPCPSLVKVKYSENGNLTEIDFPENYAYGMDKDSLPKEDSLLKYSFPDVSKFTYRSGAKSCMPYFNLKDSIIFKIPLDLSDEEYFSITDNTDLSDNTSYTFEVYDLDDAGTAKAVVRRTNVRNETFSHHHTTYIVESITEGLDNEGIPVRYVNCWSMGKFYQLYLDYDVPVRKDSGAPLSGGDIIRLNKGNNNEITSLVVDFDASSGLPEKNSYAGSIYELGNVSFTYQFGKLYSVCNDYAYITNVKDNFGEYDYSFENLKNCYVNTKNIIKYDTKTGELRPIKLSELKSYLTHGNENNFVVLRQNVFNINSIYVYE